MPAAALKPRPRPASVVNGDKPRVHEPGHNFSPTSAATSPGAAPAALSEHDLAELLGEFNRATARLNATHESLRAEVARLQGELRAANEQIERSRRLAALGEMAAGIAHEIRNPLGSIRLYAGMLEEDLLGRDAERALAQRILTAVRTVNDVVNDVLTFAREFRIRPEPVDVCELFTRAIDESLVAVRGSFRVVRLEGDGDPRSQQLTCDPSLMHRALVNIVCNALQAMQESATGASSHGVLTTDAAIRMMPQADGAIRPFVCLSITDTGPGVPADVLPRMFNPFVTTRASGTGLGLAIVHRIVDAHGGRVAVANIEVNGRVSGASVELQLPMAMADAETPAIAPAALSATADTAANSNSRTSPVTVRKTRRARGTVERSLDPAASRVMEDAR